MVVINKADGDLLPLAQKTKADYSAAFQILNSGQKETVPEVLKCSALMNTGITEVRYIFDEFHYKAKESGIFEKRRANKASKWMWEEINTILIEKLKSEDNVAKIISKLESRVENGTSSPLAAADKILQSFFNSKLI